jgi:hypothetical protein
VGSASQASFRHPTWPCCHSASPGHDTRPRRHRRRAPHAANNEHHNSPPQVQQSAGLIFGARGGWRGGVIGWLNVGAHPRESERREHQTKLVFLARKRKLLLSFESVSIIRGKKEVVIICKRIIVVRTARSWGGAGVRAVRKRLCAAARDGLAPTTRNGGEGDAPHHDASHK